MYIGDVRIARRYRALVFGLAALAVAVLIALYL
jgi:hypothetical protein